MKKRCFALLLALSLLLTGCSPLFDLYSAFRGEYTRPDYSDGAISYREFQRPYQPRDRRQGRCGRHHQPVRRGL